MAVATGTHTCRVGVLILALVQVILLLRFSGELYCSVLLVLLFFSDSVSCLTNHFQCFVKGGREVK